MANKYSNWQVSNCNISQLKSVKNNNKGNIRKNVNNFRLDLKDLKMIKKDLKII